MPQCYSENLSSVITRSHWTLLTVSTRQFSWGLQKPLRDFFDHELCRASRGCALGPNWGLSTGVPWHPPRRLGKWCQLIQQCQLAAERRVFGDNSSVEFGKICCRKTVPWWCSLQTLQPYWDTVLTSNVSKCCLQFSETEDPPRKSRADRH